MKHLFRSPYRYWLIVIFGVYLLLNIFLSQFYITIKYLPIYFDSLNWPEFVVSIVFTLSIASLVSLNSVLGYLRWKERNITKESTLLCVGGIGGLATGVCPACVTSVFPFILGFFGISFSWISLPFRGFEIQLLVIGILSINFYFLNRKKGVRK